MSAAEEPIAARDVHSIREINVDVEELEELNTTTVRKQDVESLCGRKLRSIKTSAMISRLTMAYTYHSWAAMVIPNLCIAVCEVASVRIDVVCMRVCRTGKQTFVVSIAQSPCQVVN